MREFSQVPSTCFGRQIWRCKGCYETEGSVHRLRLPLRLPCDRPRHRSSRRSSDAARHAATCAAPRQTTPFLLLDGHLALFPLPKPVDAVEVHPPGRAHQQLVDPCTAIPAMHFHQPSHLPLKILSGPYPSECSHISWTNPRGRDIVLPENTIKYVDLLHVYSKRVLASPQCQN